MGKQLEKTQWGSQEVRLCFLLQLPCSLLPQNSTRVSLECGEEPVGLRERRS